jgi:hypothetical protein
MGHARLVSRLCESVRHRGVIVYAVCSSKHQVPYTCKDALDPVAPRRMLPGPRDHAAHHFRQQHLVYAAHQAATAVMFALVCWLPRRLVICQAWTLDSKNSTHERCCWVLWAPPVALALRLVCDGFVSFLCHKVSQVCTAHPHLHARHALRRCLGLLLAVLGRAVQHGWQCSCRSPQPPSCVVRYIACPTMHITVNSM